MAPTVDLVGMPEPRPPRPPSDLRSLFERSLDEIERIVAWISYRTCLRGDDAEEFRSWVHLKLMEDDFGILRRHSGRSSLATYLTAVIHNLARDFRSKRWGRWRPSAAAERLGVVAVQLETLLHRDGFSLGVATEMLQRHHGVRLSAVEIAALAERLPQAVKASVEGDERLESVPAHDRSDEGLLRSEGMATLEETRRALRESLAELDVEDRLILRMHYESGLTLAAVAAALGLRQRRLYTRRDASLRTLRAGLERRGLDAAEILAALHWSGDEGDFDFEAAPAEAPDSGPSNSNEPTGSGQPRAKPLPTTGTDQE